MDQHFEHSMLSGSLDSSHPLSLLLRNRIKATNSDSTGALYWGADHYQLHNSKLFNSLKNQQQEDIVLRLNQWSLELIYFIEKFGLNYGAKMISMAESEQEKSLYSVFAADEVRHRLLMEPYLLNGKPSDLSIHPLLEALSICLKEGSKQTMNFTIQVVLEGFGLMHYSSLRSNCKDAGLKQVFTEIINDEVSHHGMGVVLAKQQRLSDESYEQVMSLTSLIVNSLLNANWVEKSLEISIGSLSLSDKRELKTETGWYESHLFKVNKISELIAKVGYKPLLTDMNEKGLFKI